jgi:uncharacterized repeat protein (TIGR03803 family)
MCRREVARFSGFHTAAKLLVTGMLTVLTVALAPPGFGQGYELLYSFDFTNGAYPSSFILGRDGNFYGTTSDGGEHWYGTVFRLSPGGELVTLCSFDASDGVSPGALVEGTDGNFYGSAPHGGAHDGGTIFRCTPEGRLTRLLSFPNVGGEGVYDPLVEGTDGAFYGTTWAGGSNFLGGIVRITTNGVMTTIASFDRTNGSRPLGCLTPDGDGNYYGTANQGASNGYGSVFRVTPAGEITTVHSFTAADGSPAPGLTRRRDGTFLGASSGPYPLVGGFLYSVTPLGESVNLVQFGGLKTPVSRFAEDAAGNLYGTTTAPDGYGMGTLFKLTPDGELSTLVTFSGANGAYPYTGLVSTQDGSLYGVTQQGGVNGYGVVFRLSLPPFLNVQRSGGTVILSWPTNSTGFTLQTATNVARGTPWAEVTNVPGVAGANFVVSDTMVPPTRFYRLEK